MKILSFDVGIKNLAICLLETNDSSSKKNIEKYGIKKQSDEINSNVTILDWQLVDLSPTVIHKCVFKKKKSNDLCGLSASYKDPQNNCYCKRHAKSTEFLIPDTKLNTNQLKRNSLKKLNEIIDLYKIKDTLELKTKENLINVIENYKKQNFLSAIEKESSKANKDSLISLCRIMTQKLDALYSSNEDLYKDIDTVLIENQIGKIAVRMKSIQGMLTQYFVGRGIQNIEYVSSMNKLKNFCEKKNMNYKERKAESIVVTRNQIELYNPNWLEFFNNFSKKDDLADCFLQALWKLNE
jgi:hypothetical protein